MTDLDLLYAATARCRCGAGLAYAPASTGMHGAWVCSRVLIGEAPPDAMRDKTPAYLGLPAVKGGGHDSLPVMFWKVREETAINNEGGHTTRPPGTVARTVGRAVCPACHHEWESEPYKACGQPHHWFSGPCPSCGHAVGGDGVYSSGDGPRIETRYRDVFLVAPEPPG